jgi:hypothetical protein
MKKIKLTKGYEALVDNDDFAWLNQFKWHYNNGTAMRHRGILMHREIINTPQDMDTDHINGNRLDNRRRNLRVCTASLNSMNRKKRTNNVTSIYKGVNSVIVHGRHYWKTQIRKKGMYVYIGYFKQEQHAAMAYDIWAKDLFGEFAKLNFT